MIQRYSGKSLPNIVPASSTSPQPEGDESDTENTLSCSITEISERTMDPVSNGGPDETDTDTEYTEGYSDVEELPKMNQLNKLIALQSMTFFYSKPQSTSLPLPPVLQPKSLPSIPRINLATVIKEEDAISRNRDNAHTPRT